MSVFWRMGLLFFIIIGLGACTTMRSIEPTPMEVTRHFEKGDVIKVYTKDGTAITFEVIDITQDAIIGSRETISFQEITKIEKKKVTFYA